MAKVEGLNLRGSRWYVRIIIPDDLREMYGRGRVNVALGTSDRREAVELATIKRGSPRLPPALPSVLFRRHGCTHGSLGNSGGLVVG